MSKSILVLEENSVIHGLVASALDMDGLTVHHEFNPAKYVDRARTLQPDLILISNADQDNNYAILRQLKTQAGLGSVPLVLLANSRDRVDPGRLKEFKVAGLVRKPFEASDLQQQVSKHLDLIDLVGSAYEYRKSQSVRDEGLNPLAHIDALDPDVATLMQESGKGIPLRERAVPEVDFSRELRQEMRPTPAPQQTGAAATAPPAAQPSFDDLGVLNDGPVESFSAGTAGALPGEDVLLDEEDLGPPLGDLPRPEGMPSFAETALEELGPEDLLDEEAYEEATFAAAGVDQTLDRTPAAPGGAGMDEIEVELSGDDLMFPAEPPEQPAAARAVPEPFPDFPAGAAAPAAAEGDIPPAVRRMMELKPVFSKAPAAAAPAPAPSHEPAEFRPPQAEGEGFQLGDEELDEAAIQRALETEEPKELTPLDEADPELLGLASSEEIDVEAAGEPEALEPLAAVPEQDDQDLTIDEDEQELILASLDEEGAPAFPSGPLELTKEERAGLTEMLDQGPAAAAAAEGMERDELDLLDAYASEQEALPPAGAGTEAEGLFDDTFQNMPAAPKQDEAGTLHLPLDEVLEVPVPETGIAGETASLSGPELPGTELSEIELPGIESWSTQATEPDAAAPSAPSGEAAAVPDSFEDAFAALKDEIEANPQGERLEDILKTEQLQEAVARIRFTIPQHEHALARGIPLYGLPRGFAGHPAGGAAMPAQGAAAAPVMAETVMTEASLTQPAPQRPAGLRGEAEGHGAGRAGVDAAGSLLDEPTRARLSQVLDEIISSSVRKAVREEMPRLMERIAKERGAPA